MRLYNAIKVIVNLKGKYIISDSSLLNYLNDYHAFEERPASKLVLRDIINGGYSDKILQLNNAENSWTIKLKSYEHDFVDSCGYKEELVLYVFQSLSYAVNLTDNKPGEGMDEVLDFHPFFDEDVPSPTKQPSTPTPKQGNDSVDNKDYLKIAQDFIDNGKLETARSIAEKIVNGSAKDDENTIKAMIMLGHIMRKKDQYKDALVYYNKALNAEANFLKISAKDLQHRITNRKVKDFEDIDIHYMFCLLGIGHIDKEKWTEYVRSKAAKGNTTALMYCAHFKIDPQIHVDINNIGLFFFDYNKIRKGDIVFSDGSFTHQENLLSQVQKMKKVIGRVFSLNTVALEHQKGLTHGRIMAIPNNYKGDDFYPCVQWGPRTDLQFPHTHYSDEDLKHLDKINSYLYSELLIKDLYNVPNTAFYVARNWKENIPLKNASPWYLPSFRQALEMRPFLRDIMIWTSTQVNRETALACSNIGILTFYKDYPLNHVVPIFSF